MFFSPYSLKPEPQTLNPKHSLGGAAWIPTSASLNPLAERQAEHPRYPRATNRGPSAQEVGTHRLQLGRPPGRGKLESGPMHRT